MLWLYSIFHLVFLDVGHDFMRRRSYTDLVFITWTHLNSGLRKVDFQGYLFSHEYVWVPCFGKQGFEDVQLRAREGSAFPTLLPRSGWTSKHTLSETISICPVKLL